MEIQNEKTLFYHGKNEENIVVGDNITIQEYDVEDPRSVHVSFSDPEVTHILILEPEDDEAPNVVKEEEQVLPVVQDIVVVDVRPQSWAEVRPRHKLMFYMCVALTSSMPFIMLAIIQPWNDYKGK